MIDKAMDLIELDNPSLRGVLPKTCARPSLDLRRLGELVDLISGIGLGAAAHREKDLLGRVYEYFLGRFASAEGRRRVLHPPVGGQAARRDDRAAVRPGVRRVLRLRRHVRAGRTVRRSPRRAAQRHRGIRPGAQRHHLAAGEDEPRHPRHRSEPGHPLGRHPSSERCSCCATSSATTTTRSRGLSARMKRPAWRHVPRPRRCPDRRRQCRRRRSAAAPLWIECARHARQALPPRLRCGGMGISLREGEDGNDERDPRNDRQC